MLLTLLYFAAAALPFLIFGITLQFDPFYADNTNPTEGFLLRASGFEDPNPPGCKKPQIQVLYYPRKCNFNENRGTVITTSNNIAKAIITGGTPPYQIRWDNQALSPTFTPPAGDAYSTNAGISEGWHHIEVIDAAGQRAYSQFFLAAEPSPILNLRVRHYCVTGAGGGQVITTGQIQYMGNRYLEHYSEFVDLFQNARNLTNPASFLNFSLTQIFAPPNNFANTVIANELPIQTIDSYALTPGVYNIRIGCYNFLVRIMNKCDIVGTVEEFKAQCENCT